MIIHIYDFLSLIPAIIFFAMCWIHLKCEDEGAYKSFLGLLFTLFINSCLSEIKKSLDCGVRCLLKFSEKPTKR